MPGIYNPCTMWRKPPQKITKEALKNRIKETLSQLPEAARYNSGLSPIIYPGLVSSDYNEKRSKLKEEIINCLSGNSSQYDQKLREYIHALQERPDYFPESYFNSPDEYIEYANKNRNESIKFLAVSLCLIGVGFALAATVNIGLTFIALPGLIFLIGIMKDGWTCDKEKAMRNLKKVDDWLTEYQRLQLHPESARAQEDEQTLVVSKNSIGGAPINNGDNDGDDIELQEITSTGKMSP